MEFLSAYILNFMLKSGCTYLLFKKSSDCDTNPQIIMKRKVSNSIIRQCIQQEVI